LKTGAGGVGSGAPPAKANCVMKLKSKDFIGMINGTLKPTTAFMTGKLKITGDLSLAMKLEKLLSSLKSKL
jgi:putative sterol carrier protein